MARHRRHKPLTGKARRLFALALAVALPGLAVVAAPAEAAPPPLPAVTSTPPPDAMKTVPYSHQFTATGSNNTWRVADGSLPPGLALDPATGVLSGTVAVTGSFGPVTVATSSPRVVSMSSDHGCALRPDGSADCWGDNTYGQATDQPGPYTAIATPSTFGAHTCALRPDGSADCWGDDYPDGQATDQPGPYTAISSGSRHNCALRPDGSADCWGRNLEGQATDQEGPYTAISAGFSHTCALRPDGSADCWGNDSDGQATDQAGPYTTIASGNRHTCALRPDGSADCWGNNSSGQAEDRPGPYIAIDTAPSHTCAVRIDGGVECWGSSVVGMDPVEPGNYLGVFTKYSHVCALRTDGALDCWGGSPYGMADDRPGPYALATQTFTIDVGSQAPAIAAVADQAIAQGTGTGPLSFLIGDDDDPASSLVVSATSSDQALVPDANLVLAGTGVLRSVAVTPAPDATGSATITLTVTDPDGLSATTSFTVEVTPDVAEITGRVTIGGTAGGGVIVAAFETDDGFLPGAATLTDADGRYRLTGLVNGQHRLAFLAPSSTGAPITWWSDASSTGVAARTAATALEITSATSDHPDTDIDLVAGATVSGTVTDAQGSPAAGTTVRAWSASDTWLPTAETTTGLDGTYTLSALPPGDYRLHFAPAPGTPDRGTWHDGAETAAAATVHSLSAGQQLGGIDAQLGAGAGISGTITDLDDLGVADVAVLAYRSTDTWVATARTTTGPDGAYSLAGLPPGTYRLQLVPATGSGLPRTWLGGATRSSALEVSVALGEEVSGTDAVLVP